MERPTTTSTTAGDATVQVTVPATIAPVGSLSHALDEAPRSRFHRRAVVVSGMGFFTDAYDLFVIGTVATLVAKPWHLSTDQKSWVSGSAILAAFVGAMVFGRVADLLGRKRVYVTVSLVMIVGALASAFAPNFTFLVVARFVLGLGIGGDYPVSAVLMSEYANRRDRGRLVGLVFSMQAIGLVVGPLVGLVLLSSGLSSSLTWRILLGLGAVPAAAVVWMRTRMPESPRFVAQVRGDTRTAAHDLARFSEGVAAASATGGGAEGHGIIGFTRFLAHRGMLKLLVATAGCWFLFDYAYYGNTLSLSSILTKVDKHASVSVTLAWSLGMLLVFAVPGYVLAVTRIDRVGHRRLQLLGFAMMLTCFGVLAAVRPATTSVVPFLLVFGLSYFFVQYGPNMTTFVFPSEVFPVSQRTTGHGFAAGVGKLGAFVGVFAVPQLEKHIELRGMLVVAAVSAGLGFLLTLALPEPSGRSLEELGATSAPSATSAAGEPVHRDPPAPGLVGAGHAPARGAGRPA